MIRDEILKKAYDNIVSDLGIDQGAFVSVINIKNLSLLRVNLANLYYDAFMYGMQEAEEIWMKKGEK